MKNLQFSVIIPTLNEEKFVSKLLTSLREQSVKNFEVIVVDGHSKDRTVFEVKKFAARLPLTVVIGNTGVSCQRNLGATIAKAQWLVFVDADSVLFPHFFDRIGAFIDATHTRFFTTWLKSDGDEPADAIAGFLLNMGIEGGVLIERPWAPGPLTIVRRDVFRLVGGYNETVTYGEDHELGVSIYRRGVPFDILREILYIHSFRRYRQEGTFKVMNRGLKSTLKIIFTHQGLKHMPGFIGGGSIYDKPSQKEKTKLFFERLEKRIDKFIKDFMKL